MKAAALLARWIGAARMVDAGYLFDLIVAAHHPPYLTRHRADAIATRTKLVSAAFAGFTLLWIALDYSTLPWPTWGHLAGLRCLSAGLFGILAVFASKERSLPYALGILAALLINPMIFFVAGQALFSGVALDGAALVNTKLYGALPFIILAGLSVFPLTILEGLLFAVPILAITVLTPVALGSVDWIQIISTLWVLLLILGVYVLAGMIQLHYMMALLRRANLDALTGAFMRRSGAELIELHFSLARQQDAPLAVVFIDIDDFKSINDTHGHDEGDRVLRGVAETLGRLFRRGDAVVRWGGEEFVIILPNTDGDGIEVAMRRLVKNWLGTRPDGRPVTASVGVAERISDHAENWAALIDLADERMYVAKRSGKAKCVVLEGRIIEADKEPEPLGVDGLGRSPYAEV